MIVEIVIVVLLILVNAFFAMSEMALVNARRARLQGMAEAGHRGARAALTLAEDPSRLLSTVQVGITLVGIFAGAFGGATLSVPLRDWLATQPVVGPWADGLSFALVVFAITYFSLIVGELVPKRIALNHAETIAARVARPMQRIASVGAPVVWLLQRSTELVLRLLGISSVQGQTVTEEEVKSLIAEGTEAGVFVEAEREMIEGVLRLADRSVRSIMTPRHEMVWIDLDDSPDEIRKTISSSGCSRFPVARGSLDELEGMVQTKDMLDRMLQGGPFDIAETMRPPLVVPDGTPALKLLQTFRSSAIHLAVVVDEYGSVEGLVTPSDILSAIAGEVGDLSIDADGYSIVRREDGSWLVDAMTPIDEVERLLRLRGLRSPEDDYHTLAGFVLWHLGRMPKVAESFVENGMRYEVMDMDGNRIDKVLVRVEMTEP
ncbi:MULTISPECIES: hemolysin family protein [Inquilinus]|uniref:Hemolysin n=1 Tax=Inquilinus ginsengisoli TaxID=363840 RepID=A0ABU1JUT5_9PROT|nr:hemolysin family protein [Inquilinus ginsengisoli]MDR6292389.1 putative hemolysin [Inquilinus ginsengisoli]